MKLKIGLVAAAAVFACTPICVAAGQDAPPVEPVPPAVEPPSADAVAGFAKRYRASGSPRLMIFWGRNLDESLETQRRRREVVDISAQRQRLRMTSSVGEVVDDQPRFTALDSQQGATLESAFKQTLLATGARLVDRNASVRATHAQGTRSERNAQLVEA